MAVMPRESWTDARLDDFRGEVNRRFDEVYRRFDETDRRIDATNQRIDETNERIDETNERINETNQRMEEGFVRITDRLDGLHRLLFQAMVALIVGLLGAITALIAQL